MALISARLTDNSIQGSVIRFFADNNRFSHLNNSKFTIFPGFCDVHVHFREPGFVYKEDIYSGSMAAARGGYTAVCTMPNLNPVPDSEEHLKIQVDAINEKAKIALFPYASITQGQQGEQLSQLLLNGARVIAFSDDGKGVQNDNLMLQAMTIAKKHNAIIVAHCEDNSLLRGGYIHDGDYAKAHGHKGICSESEYGQIARDIELAKKTGCKYHVCHISTKESVDLIAKAKAEGVDITCETAPHYLLLNDSCLQESGAFKMNPPLRSEEDRLALIEGIKNGTIDMIATDHAPHSAEEKSLGLAKSAFGIVGIETAFPLLYTYLVKNGVISIEKLLGLLTFNARKRFNITTDLGFSVWDLGKQYVINPDEFLSKGKSTPFNGTLVNGENLLTVYNDRVIYKKDKSYGEEK